jgi:RHS repeat-associated protein
MPSPRETVLCQYHYDPLDQLIGHALPDTPECQRFYCKSRLATEILGATRCSTIQHGDQLLAQQRSERDKTSTTMLTTDQQHSVLQALNADHSEQPTAYSPYGHRPVDSGFLSLLGFNGEPPDSLTGCYLLGNGYRAFNPVLMRFNSPDSWSPFGKGGLNAYAYCAGDPVNRRDPTGHALLLKALMMFSEIKITVRPAANPALGYFGLLGKFENHPNIYEAIIRNMKGRDMLKLALQSKEMKLIVYKSAKKMPKLANSYAGGYFIEGFEKGILPYHAKLATTYHKTAYSIEARSSTLGRPLRPSEAKNADIGRPPLPVFPNRNPTAINALEIRRRHLRDDRLDRDFGDSSDFSD